MARSRGCLFVDHGTIVRQGSEMIGKLQRDQRSRVRDQKKNDLRRRWRGCLGGGGLDRVLGWGQESGKTKGTSRLLSPGFRIEMWGTRATLNCALAVFLLLWREHQQESTDRQDNDNIREVPVYTVLPRLDSLDCHHRAMRQVPPRCKAGTLASRHYWTVTAPSIE